MKQQPPPEEDLYGLGSQDGGANPKLGPVAAGGGIVILGGGEASGPLYPPETIDESMFSCEVRMESRGVKTIGFSLG